MKHLLNICNINGAEVEPCPDVRQAIGGRAMKIEKCPFCGKQIAEIGNCKNMEECEHFEECPAVEPYVCVVCSINKGGCGASTGYHEGVEKAIAAWNRRAGKDTNVTTNADRCGKMER